MKSMNHRENVRRAMEEDRKKPDSPLQFDRSDMRLWRSSKNVLNRAFFDPIDPEKHAEAVREIMDANLIVFFGKWGTGKRTEAIHAADAYARAKGPCTISRLDMNSLFFHAWSKDFQAEIGKSRTSGIVIIDWITSLSPISMKPDICASFLEMLTYRESSPDCGPTIILSLIPPNEIAARFMSQTNGFVEALCMKLDRAKKIQF